MSIFTSSIRTKIIIPYVFLTLIVGAAGTFFGTQYVDNTLEDRLKKQLIGAARAANQIIIDQEEERLAVLRLILATEDMAGAIQNAKGNQDYDRLDQYIQAYAANYPDIDSIILLDEMGNEIYKLNRDQGEGTPGLLPTVFGAAEGYGSWEPINAILNDNRNLSSGRVKGDQGEEDIVYSIAPLKEQNQIVSVILVGHYLEDLLGEIKLESFADITFYNDQDPKGSVRNTTLPVDDESVLNITSEFYDQVVGDLTVTRNQRVMVLNQEYELAFAPFQLRGGTIGLYSVGVLTEFVTGPVQITSNIFAAIIFVAITVLMLIALLVTQQIIRPLARLVSTSGAIAAGDLTRETGISSGDEIGRLATSFDQMTGQLRRRTEQLEELVKLQSAILSSIADGVLVQDKAGQIVQLNPAAEKILAQLSEAFSNYEAQDLIPLAQTILTRLTPPSSQMKNGVYRATDDPIKEITGGIQAQITATANPNDDPPKNFEIGDRSVSTRAAPVVTDNDENLGSVVVLRDITSEVEAEKLKTNLIRGISHELLTPLVPMRLSLQLLQMTLQGKLEDKQVDLLNKIDNSSQELHALISTLIDFVQVEAEGTPASDMSVFDLVELVEDVGWQVQERIAETGLEFSIEIPQTSISVQADESRLRRVINALLDNAVKYNRPEGTISLSLEQQNQVALIQVIDTGVGIDQSLQPYLTKQPFLRAVAGDDDIRGNGLGLYLAGKIIEAHQGRIWFESQMGEGSTFYLEIPISESSSSTEETSETEVA
ncbi:MAG: ATP-binding protein [Chloroflexota bacterium]